MQCHCLPINGDIEIISGWQAVKSASVLIKAYTVKSDDTNKFQIVHIDAKPVWLYYNNNLLTY